MYITLQFKHLLTSPYLNMDFETPQERKNVEIVNTSGIIDNGKKKIVLYQKMIYEFTKKRAADQIGDTEVDIVERRSAIAQQVKRSRRAHIQVMSVNEHYCGAMTFICKHCRSLNFESEKTTRGIFSHFCHNGTVTIPRF